MVEGRTAILCLSVSVVIFSVALFSSAPVRAAKIGCDFAFRAKQLIPYETERWPLRSRPSSGTCFQAFLVGEIKKGDYEKVRTLYAKNHPFIGTFVISSIGGDVVEALKIGTFFRKYLIQVIGPSGDPKVGFLALTSDPKNRCNKEFDVDCGCASACALIWFGAVQRTSGSSSFVGLHRPRIEDQAFKALPADEAYKNVLANVVHYLDEMEVPKRLIDAMVATGSSEIKWVQADFELGRPPSIAEWVDATCRPLSPDERKSKRLFEDKSEALRKNGTKLPENEMQLLIDFGVKQFTHDMCETVLFDSRREKLPKP